MNFTTIIPKFNRLCLQPHLQNVFRNVSTNTCLFFKTSPCLMAEPLKKKKKMDPQIVKAREDRKRKRIQKQIRRLEKNAKQLKPLDECEVPLALLDEKKQRQRNIIPSAEVLEKRVLLEKQWGNYKRVQLLEDLQMIDRVMYHQQRAMDELKKESEELYQEALQFDFHLSHVKIVGPVETPPIENYDVPDGAYEDISRKWE